MKLFQVKYTNRVAGLITLVMQRFLRRTSWVLREMYAFDLPCCKVGTQEGFTQMVIEHVPSLSSSGSNQAREGRLVDALAVRGDEGRDTLR